MMFKPIFYMLKRVNLGIRENLGMIWVYVKIYINWNLSGIK
jgi:uncharacterized membrane protein